MFRFFNGNSEKTYSVLLRTDAHSAKQTHHYTMHYPEHPARTEDPHYKEFNAYHDKFRPTARCYVGERIGFDECHDAQGNPAPPPQEGEQPGLELHHHIIEFSLQNGVDMDAFTKDNPGVTNIGEWIESGANFWWLCAWHHRGAAGVHNASHSDFTASLYIKGLIT